METGSNCFALCKRDQATVSISCPYTTSNFNAKNIGINLVNIRSFFLIRSYVCCIDTWAEQSSTSTCRALMILWEGALYKGQVHASKHYFRDGKFSQHRGGAINSKDVRRTFQKYSANLARPRAAGSAEQRKSQKNNNEQTVTSTHGHQDPKT